MNCRFEKIYDKKNVTVYSSPTTTQQEIVTATGTEGNLATHYILSYEDIAAKTLSSFSNVIVDNPAAIPGQ